MAIPPPFSAVLYTVDRIRNIHNNGGGRRSAWAVLCLCFCIVRSFSIRLTQTVCLVVILQHGRACPFSSRNMTVRKLLCHMCEDRICLCCSSLMRLRLTVCLSIPEVNERRFLVIWHPKNGIPPLLIPLTHLFFSPPVVSRTLQFL